MKVLQEKGLFGAGLVPVTSKLLVDRYNDCLREIGKEPTQLKRFAIDAAGWSPQIAGERRDPNYLCHGEANLYAIVLTPDQKGKPVYMPMHSFDWKVLDSFYSEQREPVHNLTGMTGIVLDIDQGIDEYYSPFDLLMMHSISVKASTPHGMMGVVKEQRALVARFRHEEDSYTNTALIEKLVESAQKNGDLRHKALTLPEILFSDVGNFYTRAMGGVFVFRNLPRSRDPIIVTESKDITTETRGNEPNLYSLRSSRDEALRAMEEAGLLVRVTALSPEDRLARLEEIIEYLMAQAIYSSGYKGDLTEATAAQKKGLVLEARDHLPQSYRELSDRLRSWKSNKKSSSIRLSKEAWRHSLVPNPKLDSLSIDVIWQLLSRVDPFHLEMTFLHSRQQFYALYQGWSPGQRKWAVHQLEAKGLPYVRDSK